MYPPPFLASIGSNSAAIVTPEKSFVVAPFMGRRSKPDNDF